MREFDTRVKMYDWLAEQCDGGRVAEVGVWRGDNAADILKYGRPDMLMLIDHWQKTDDPTNAEMNQHEQPYHDWVFSSVIHRFFEDRRVIVMRMESEAAARLFDKGTFDWVYLDASHEYPSVQIDHWQWRYAVKPSGFVCGHDYASRRHPGVKRAVDGLIEAGLFEMVALTKDYPQSYALKVLR